jgi:hypothetical protein
MEDNKIILDMIQFMGLLRGQSIKMIQGEGIPNLVIALDPYDVPQDKGDILSLIEDYWDNKRS